MDEATVVKPPGEGEENGEPAPSKRAPGFHGMDILMAIDLLLILGLVGLSIYQFVTSIASGETQSAGLGEVTSEALWMDTLFSLLIFGGIPFLWVLGTRVKAWQGTIEYFGLDRVRHGVMTGLGLGAGVLVGLLVVGLLMSLAGAEADNQAVDDIGNAITWPLVIGVAISAGLGEEIFFRGVLQKHLGMWGQAAVFGVLHIAQGVLGVAVTFAIGLAFGYMVKRGFPLWTVIVAHIAYDIVVLAAAKVGL